MEIRSFQGGRHFRSWARRAMSVALIVAPLSLAAGCAPAVRAKKSVAREAGTHVTQLWVEPKDLESRDLYLGPGGKSHVPDLASVYRVVGYDETGHSRGYEVEDDKGREWRVKVGEEAQSEIVVSRILWAIGYHQPVMHFVTSWRMTGGKPGAAPAPGRFRLESDHKNVGFWSWSKDNPFDGKRALRGLIVANLLLNNWDFGPDQNRIYEAKDGQTPRLRFVVQDVGGSLGKSRWPIGTRNNIEDFESEGFVKRVEGDRVVFHYRSWHRRMVRDITVEDVVWTCGLLSRLSDAQLRDAFRAAHYSPELADRYIRKIKDKIREGTALAPAPGARTRR